MFVVRGTFVVGNWKVVSGSANPCLLPHLCYGMLCWLANCNLQLVTCNPVVVGESLVCVRISEWKLRPGELRT